MLDLVARLRNVIPASEQYALRTEAADEIERLRAEKEAAERALAAARQMPESVPERPTRTGTSRDERRAWIDYAAALKQLCTAQRLEIERLRAEKEAAEASTAFS